MLNKEISYENGKGFFTYNIRRKATYSYSTWDEVFTYLAATHYTLYCGKETSSCALLFLAAYERTHQPRRHYHPLSL